MTPQTMNTMQQIGDLTGRKFAALGTSSQLEAALADSGTPDNASQVIVPADAVLPATGYSLANAGIDGSGVYTDVEDPLDPNGFCRVVLNDTATTDPYSHVIFVYSTDYGAKVTGISMQSYLEGLLETDSKDHRYIRFPLGVHEWGYTVDIYQYYFTWALQEGQGKLFHRGKLERQKTPTLDRWFYAGTAYPSKAVTSAITSYMIAQGYWAE